MTTFPNLVYRFRVAFTTGKGPYKHSFSDQLSAQILSVETPFENGRNYSIGISFQDDLLNDSIRGIETLKGDQFNIEIFNVDSNGNATRKTFCKNCKIVYTEFSNLDYSTKIQNAEKLVLNIPPKFSKLLEDLRDQNPFIDALIESMNGAMFSIEKKSQNDIASKIVVLFECDSVEYVYLQTSP